jgi:hypothetical protein
MQTAHTFKPFTLVSPRADGQFARFSPSRESVLIEFVGACGSLKESKVELGHALRSAAHLLELGYTYGAEA